MFKRKNRKIKIIMAAGFLAMLLVIAGVGVFLISSHEANGFASTSLAKLDSYGKYSGTNDNKDGIVLSACGSSTYGTCSGNYCNAIYTCDICDSQCDTANYGPNCCGIYYGECFSNSDCCTPNSSCAASTCVGQTCKDSCGNTYSGTKSPDCSCAVSTCIMSTCPDGCGGTCYGSKNCSTCTPDSSCAANTCTGNTCMDICGNYYNGTKVCSCTDTSWSPSTNTVCSGTQFTQTGSPCGDTRTATGTESCSCTDTSWSPSTNTVCSGTQFTQTGSPCGDTRTATGTESCSCTDTSWSPDPSTVCSGTQFTQTGSPCGDTKTATGTETCSGGSSSTNYWHEVSP